MNENGSSAPASQIADPTVDRNLLLARVGEGQMKLEAVLAHVEVLNDQIKQLTAEVIRLRPEQSEPVISEPNMAR